MKADISIIIPVYKGQHYIHYWLDKIEKNTIYLDSLHLQCELILVNDFPEEDIIVNDIGIYRFSVKIFNLRHNQGIHGARVYGLEHSEGDWIVFLDQDDVIADDYVVKQKECIKNADAVVCNGYIKFICKNVCNFIYMNREDQGLVNNLSHYFFMDNPICSPGQVMIRREAIPDLWCQHKLKANGADDYYLWILMLKAGKSFSLNEEKLYTHIEHENNASKDVESMTCSLHEAAHLMEENNLLNDLEKEIIYNIKKTKYVIGLSAVYDCWLYLEHRNQNVAEYLRRYGCNKICIYGMDLLGDRLYDLLTDSNVKAVFAIDRNAKKFICNVPVFCLEDVQVDQYMKQIDTVIVTVISDFESIKKTIRNKYEVSVLSLKDILVEMVNTLGA